MWCSAVGVIVTLTLSLLGTPRTAVAQQPGMVPRIGILTPAAEASTPVWEAFRQGLHNLGYVEGRTIVLEYRLTAGQDERLPELAAELVRRNVDLIVAEGWRATQAAKEVTATIPIVMASAGDPVRHGLVARLARPGGNVTGLSLMSPELSGKRLELLKAAFPTVSRIAVLWCPPLQAVSFGLQETEAAARVLDIQLHPVQACTPDALGSAFATMTREGAEALMTLSNIMLWNHRAQVVALAIQHRLPVVFPEREFVDAGGLMAYGASIPESFRRAATYVDKILKGAKPADLPVEQPTKFELVINLKTAQALGLTIPPTFLSLADEVIR